MSNGYKETAFMVGGVVRDHLEQAKPEPLPEEFGEMVGKIGCQRCDESPDSSGPVETQVEKVKRLMQRYGFTQEQACSLLARFEDEERLHEAARKLQSQKLASPAAR